MGRSRRSRSNSVKKCTHTFKSGRITRNPFLNFLRDFRRSNGGLKLTELTRRGAEIWRKMNDRQKSPYCHLARQAPKRRYKKRRHSKKERRVRRNNENRHQDSKKNDHQRYDETLRDRCIDAATRPGQSGQNETTNIN